MKHKFISILLAAAMVLSMAACGGSPSQSQPDHSSADGSADTKAPEDKLTYSAVAVLHASTYDLDDSLPMQILQEKYNIDIEFQSLLSSELSEKRNLLLNSCLLYTSRCV